MSIGLTLLVAVVKSILILAILLTGFAYATLLERKLVAGIQVRYGPNRVGPWGLLQPLADGIKLAFKEDTTPRGADRFLFTLAPLISTVMALCAFAVIPVGPAITIAGQTIGLELADVNIALLYLLAITSLSVYGIVLAGWSSNNKYSLLGGIRSSAQMISYELSLGLALVGVMLITGSLRLTDIVDAQRSVWFVFLQPLGFIVYIISAIAETNRAPFDLPEAESELVAGYHTEYSGMKFAMFFMAEYINMITVSSIATTLFFGGWHGPFGLLDGPWWFFLKVFIFMCIYVWIRATLPRFRYDRLMNFGWKVLLPLALLNTLLTAGGVLVLT
ncbi:MAG TPA: NADH-quinone oxidoreductase subunit NuoH [Isosphaeraceae bacterium]|nr:NADH-quinone oxidoreductase subunit NuoH [Isosphaeraceae bacterium]